MLVYQYIKIYLLELFRNKSATFFTVILPTLLLFLFGKQGDTTSLGQWHMLIAMSNYAIQSSMFLALGMSIVYAKNSKWDDFLKILPAPAYYPMTGRIVAMLISAFLSLIILIIAGYFWLTIQLTAYTMVMLIIAAFIGAMPMGLLGALIGYATTPSLARSLFVTINLLLFFASFSLPEIGISQYIRYFIPSCQWFSISNSLVLGSGLASINVVGLAIFTIIFFFLATYYARSNK